MHFDPPTPNLLVFCPLELLVVIADDLETFQKRQWTVTLCIDSVQMHKTCVMMMMNMVMEMIPTTNATGSLFILQILPHLIISTILRMNISNNSIFQAWKLS